MYKRKKSSKTTRKTTRKNGLVQYVKAAVARRLRIFAVSLVLVFGTFLVLGAVYAFQYFRTNLTQASSGISLNTGSLDTSHDFNVLVFETESFRDPTSAIVGAAIANFKPSENKLIILKLNPSDPVNNVYGSGKISISALFGLSSLSSTNQTSKFSMEKVLALQLGIPIDGVVYTDAAGYGKISGNIGLNSGFFTSGHNFIKNSLDFSKIIVMLGSSLKTNLDVKSVVSLGKYLITDFPKSTETLTAVGVLENQNKYDLLFKDRLACQEILEERQSIIILNGTKSLGLAGNMGRITSNLGLSLLGSFNTPAAELYTNSILITKNPSSYTTSRLANIFNIDDVRPADSLANDTKFSRLLRADLILIAGSDQLAQL